MLFDLHCHSTISDGNLSPAEVIYLATTKNIELLALTDHDHTGGLHEAQAQAGDHLRFINGVEVTVTWREQCVHIVGLDFDPEHPALQKLLASNRAGRIERLGRFAALLEKHNILGVYEGALALSTNPEMVGRSHIAQFLLQQGYVKHIQQAFDHYIGEGKCAYANEEWANLRDTLEALHAAGGVAVIAHPLRYRMSRGKLRELCQEFKNLGGEGMEIISGHFNRNEYDLCLQLARAFGFYASAGSDFHRQENYSNLNGMYFPSNICPPIWQAFQRSKVLLNVANA